MNPSSDIYLFGISHSCADAATLGECGMDAPSCTRAEAELLTRSGASEAVVLSTCNRVEIYLAAPLDFDARSFPSRNFESAKWSRSRKFADACYAKRGREAIEHLFEVASGLNSQMLGETEILGQVKAAYSRAAQAGHCRAILNAAFQKAAQCAKWIRTNTQIGRGKISIGSVSSELAARIFDPLEEANILLAGSGETGRLVAEALRVRGVKNMTVASRTRENADALAASIGCRSEDIKTALADISAFDIVICASFSEEPLISARAVEDAMEKRCQPLFLIDLGIPQNIESAAADIDDAYLYNLADLSKIANENMEARKGQIGQARAEIVRRASALSKKLFGE